MEALAMVIVGDMVTQLVGHWTCDKEIEGSTFSWAPMHSTIGQVIHSRLFLSPSSAMW